MIRVPVMSGHCRVVLTQASTVKELPDVERLKSGKFTGLRWDIDPVLVEYFRFLLNDVVDSAGRRNTSSLRVGLQNSWNSVNSKPLQRTSAMLTSDRRLTINSPAAGSKATSATVSCEARRRSIFRQFSTVQQQQQHQQQQATDDSNSLSSSKALARWKKVRFLAPTDLYDAIENSRLGDAQNSTALCSILSFLIQSFKVNVPHPQRSIAGSLSSFLRPLCPEVDKPLHCGGL